MGLNGMYANELTGLCRPEELLQLFRYGVELGRKCGVTVDAAMISDVPGFTWGTIAAMAQAGIRYFFCRSQLVRPYRESHGGVAGQAILGILAFRQREGFGLDSMDGLRILAY